MKKLFLYISISFTFYSNSMNVLIWEHPNLLSLRGRFPKEEAPTNLHKACFHGNIDNVKKELVESEDDINKYAEVDDFIICTPLYTACKKGYTDIVELLLNNKNIEVNRRETLNDRKSPLHVAQNAEIAQLLINHGASINCKTIMSNETPLIKHISLGNIEIAHILLNAGADIHHKDQRGHNALFYALLEGVYYKYKNSLEQLFLCIDQLLLKGVDLFDTILYDSSDLHKLSKDILSHYEFYIFPNYFYKQYQSPVVLLEHSAFILSQIKKESDSGNVKAREKLNKALSILRSIFEYAQKEDYKKHTRIFKQRIAVRDNNLLLYHVRTHDLIEQFGQKAIEYAYYLLNGEKAVQYAHNIQNLFSAIRDHNQIMVEALIKELERNLSFVQFYGISALQYAFQYNNSKAITKLLEYDYDVSFIDTLEKRNLLEYGASKECSIALENGLFKQLMEAIKFRKYDKVLKLVNIGTKVTTAEAVTNDTPLHVTVRQQDDNEQFVQLLIKAGANINAINKFKNTPLFLAVNYFNKKCVKELLQAGARVNCFNLIKSKKSILYLPVTIQKVSIIKMLLEHGVCIHKEYSELEEKGLTGVKYTCSEISNLLKKVYDEQMCLICYEHPQLIEIPCNNYHKDNFICQICCKSLIKCPLCRLPLNVKE